MRYRFDFNAAMDQSVEAGRLLRSTIEVLCGSKAYLYNLMSRFGGMRADLDLDEFLPSIFIDLVDRKEGQPVSSRLDIMNMFNASMSSCWRKRYIVLQSRFENGEGVEYVPEVLDDGKLYTNQDPLELLTAEQILNDIKRIDPYMHSIIRMRINGALYKDIGEYFGVSRQAVHNKAKTFAESIIAKEIKNKLL